MSSLGSPNPLLFGAAKDYKVEKSLRFNEADSTSCTRTPSGAGNRKTWTFSCWIKKADVSNTAPIFLAGVDTNNYFKITIGSDNKFYAMYNESGAYNENFRSTQLFRDTTAWMNIVVAWDTTQATAANRVKVYVNGVDIPGTRTNDPALNYDGYVNNTVHHDIGRATYNAGEWFNGYIAEIHHIDGTRLDASSFGETNEDTGQWVPKKYVGSYGTNGFYLPLTGESLNTAFVDSSSYARPVTRVGDAINSTVQKKVGASSIRRPSTPNSCIHVPDSSDFDWGSNDWTLECWIRRDAQGGDEWLMAHSDGTGANTSIGLHIWSTQWGGSNANKASIRVRQSSSNIDCNATTELAANTWYHIAGVRDGNTLRIYVNGVQEGTASISGSTDTSSAPLAFTALRSNGDSGLVGYMDEIRVSKSCRYTSGTSFTPSTTAFSSDANTLVLIHSNVTGTDIAADTSGNGNNWTANNISITAGTGNDSLTDTPTNNFATLNPLILGTANVTLANGNLDFSSSGAGGVRSSIGMSSGKYYAEVKIGNSTFTVGITKAEAGPTTFLGNTAGEKSYGQNGFKIDSSAQVSYGDTFTTGDTISVAFDADGGNLYFYKNGTIQASGAAAFTGLTDGPYFFAVANNVSTTTCSLNFGQRPFSYTIPTGYKALCTANLPVPTIIKSTDFFNVNLWSGNAGTQSITMDFQPDMVWNKCRTAAHDHQRWDALRGVTKSLRQDTEIEATHADGLTAFNSNGFTLGANSRNNGSGETYVGWSWKESATAGFDIVKDEGTGSDHTIPHSLGVKPDMMIRKAIDRVDNWQVYHKDLDGADATEYLEFNSNSVQQNYHEIWNDTSPTNLVFTVGSDTSVNEDDKNYITYLFSSVEGFSKVGRYTGNGSTDGVFVYLGFKPAFLLMKRINTSEDWIPVDNKRDPDNPVANYLRMNTNAIAADGVAYDFLSNGVKFRGNSQNENNEAYVYIAFAERPFKYANAR